jgi:hypothetical protein
MLFSVEYRWTCPEWEAPDNRVNIDSLNSSLSSSDEVSKSTLTTSILTISSAYMLQSGHKTPFLACPRTFLSLQLPQPLLSLQNPTDQIVVTVHHTFTQHQLTYIQLLLCTFIHFTPHLPTHASIDYLPPTTSLYTL